MENSAIIKFIILLFILYLSFQYTIATKIQEPYPAIIFPGFTYHRKIEKPKKVIIESPKDKIYYYNSTLDSIEISERDFFKIPDEIYRKRTLATLQNFYKDSIKTRSKTLNITSNFQVVFQQPKIKNFKNQHQELKSWLQKNLDKKNKNFEIIKVKFFKIKEVDNKIYYNPYFTIDF